jgi:RimJ/RimL family protein N-acetyltransferase
VTKDVRLRDVTEGDLPILFEHQLDPEATHMAGFPARDWQAFMAHWTRILNDESVIAKTILCDEHVAGNIGSWEASGRREVGYWLGKEHWGKGVATEALSQFVAQVKARPLFAHVVAHNVASIRVLEKCGFAISGEGSDSSVTGDGVEELLLKLEA